MTDDPNRQLTLASLVDLPQRLEITCHRCSRGTVVLSPQEAIAAFGADMTFARLRRCLKCSGCGERGRDRMIDVRASMTDFYASLARDKHRRNVAEYGEAQAELLLRHSRAPHAH